MAGCDERGWVKSGMGCANEEGGGGVLSDVSESVIVWCVKNKHCLIVDTNCCLFSWMVRGVV